jgi:hypothetical protein
MLSSPTGTHLWTGPVLPSCSSFFKVSIDCSRGFHLDISDMYVSYFNQINSLYYSLFITLSPCYSMPFSTFHHKPPQSADVRILNWFRKQLSVEGSFDHLNVQMDVGAGRAELDSRVWYKYRWFWPNYDIEIVNINYVIIISALIFFLALLGLELRASQLLGRCFTPWATLPAYKCFKYSKTHFYF